MDGSITGIFLSLVSAMPSLAVFIICLYLLSKKTTSHAILLTISSGMSLVLTLFYSVLMPFLLNRQSLAFSETDLIYTVARFVSFITSVLFAVGLFMFVQASINKNQAVSNLYPPSND